MDSALKTMDLEKVSFGTNLYHLCLYYAFKQAYILSDSKSSKSDFFFRFLL